eukprot:TRINITY_DN15503_c0_g1_i1.p4 TRINITY_DN15503_c0_g1~~TRINITY_DN15503_c0_g1_i1.p4  ORF type:complete len:148 (-),score=9.63 TRINITY_DN15503_c0_g1_i1:174-617(-)
MKLFHLVILQNLKIKKLIQIVYKKPKKRTGFQDAIQTGTGLIDGIPVALGVMAFDFMGGSMGSVVGEKITCLIEYATKKGLSLILVCASGGARMQEGILSLMQMAKISAALHVYQSCANLLLYFSVNISNNRWCYSQFCNVRRFNCC